VEDIRYLGQIVDFYKSMQNETPSLTGFKEFPELNEKEAQTLLTQLNYNEKTGIFKEFEEAGLSKIYSTYGKATLDRLAGYNVQKRGLLDGFNQLIKTVTGEKAADEKKLANAQKKLSKLQKKYDEYALSENRRLIAFDEIFKIALGNRLDEMIKEVKKEENRVDRLTEAYKAEYSFILTLQKTFIGKLLIFIPTVIGGIVSDLKSIFSDGDMAALGRIASITLQVLIIAILYISGVGTAAAIALTLAVLSLIISLDSMYANNILTEAIFEMFDAVFNELLGLNEHIEVFDYFNSDSKYYEEAIMWFQMSIHIASMIANFNVSAATWEAGAKTISQGATNLLGISPSAIAGMQDLQSVYKVYSMAKGAYDTATAIIAANRLNELMEERKQKINSTMLQKNSLKMIGQMRDMRYILEGYEVQSQMFFMGKDSPKAYLSDIEGMIPYNTRYKPDSSTMYGFEELFVEEDNDFYSKMVYGWKS
jgi:hypothetical protein